MHKKYQELPAQFIPKHSHKYQLKKTLINTKFQWLMKYIHHEKMEEDPKISRAMKIQQKATVPFAQKRNIKIQNVTITPKEVNTAVDQDGGLSTIQTKKAERASRPSLKTSKSTPEQQIFMDKQKLRNRITLSRNLPRTRKTATFFEKENERVGSATKLQRYKKMKTEGNLQRSKTRMQARIRYQGEPFVLSPWMFTEQNVENSQQFRF